MPELGSDGPAISDRDVRWLMWRIRAREWFGAPGVVGRGLPGRRVRLRIGLIEVERMWGDWPLRYFWWPVVSGERIRRCASGGDPDRLARLRLMVRWPAGALHITAASLADPLE